MKKTKIGTVIYKNDFKINEALTKLTNSINTINRCFASVEACGMELNTALREAALKGNNDAVIESARLVMAAGWAKINPFTMPESAFTHVKEQLTTALAPIHRLDKATFPHITLDMDGQAVVKASALAEINSLNSVIIETEAAAEIYDKAQAVCESLQALRGAVARYKLDDNIWLVRDSFSRNGILRIEADAISIDYQTIALINWHTAKSK